MCRSEHPLDRLIRIYKEVNKAMRWQPYGDDGFAWIVGRTATKRWNYAKNPVSILSEHECEICKRRGNGRVVRSCFVFADPEGLSRKNTYSEKVFYRLCNSCRMTLDHARRKWLAYNELRLEANRIRRKLDESAKNNAGIA